MRHCADTVALLEPLIDRIAFEACDFLARCEASGIDTDTPGIGEIVRHYACQLATCRTMVNRLYGWQRLRRWRRRKRRGGL